MSASARGLAIAAGFDQSGLAMWLGEQLELLEGVSMVIVLLVVVAMLLSRMALGMHFPTDLLAGAVLGTLSALAVLPFLPLLSF